MKKEVVALRVAALLLGFSLTADRLLAAIVYVDATDGAGGNTTLVDGTQWDPLTADQGTAGDGVWARRSGFANGATIYQNAASGATDNAHRLKTTVSGLAPGTYDVYAFYWSDSSNWRMQASLTDNPGGDLPLYIFQPLTPGVVQHYTGADASVGSATLANNPFATNVLVAEGNRRMLQIPLGQVTGTSFSVYVDDSSIQADQNERTWYDGVGYSFVPEPSSLALCSLTFGLTLIVGRSRRIGS